MRLALAVTDSKPIDGRPIPLDGYAQSRRTASQRRAGLGHFPMSEDPQAFLTYLLPVLEKIARN
jgi:hypothetical protein